MTVATIATWIASRLRGLARRRLVLLRFSRYTAASVVAVGVSQLVFLLAYGVAETSSGVAVVAGFASGLAPKYLLCRNWAWCQRGRSHLGREILPYLTVSVTGAVFAYYLTEFLEDYIRHVSDGRLQVALMTAAFLASQGLFFVIKFVCLDRLVFNQRPQQP